LRVAAPSLVRVLSAWKIDRAFGEHENLRDLGRRLAARHPGQYPDLALVERDRFSATTRCVLPL
jgi:hypothetical protein